MASCRGQEVETTPPRKFQITEYETEDEQADVFPPGERLDSTDRPWQHLERQSHTAPDLRLGLQCPDTPSAEAVDNRVRLNSDPHPVEPQSPDEVGGFRGRSQSAPPNLWVAMRYGRELRRMSDEFHMTFQGLPRPKSAGYASELKKLSGWGGFFRSFFGQSKKKEITPTPKEF